MFPSKVQDRQLLLHTIQTEYTFNLSGFLYILLTIPASAYAVLTPPKQQLFGTDSQTNNLKEIDNKILSQVEEYSVQKSSFEEKCTYSQ